MTDKAFFDYSRFDYTRFDSYLPHFDDVVKKLEMLTRGKGNLDPSTVGACRAGYFRVGVTIPAFEALKNRLERLG
jgi:hypothetical protein